MAANSFARCPRSPGGIGQSTSGPRKEQKEQKEKEAMTGRDRARAAEEGWLGTNPLLAHASLAPCGLGAWSAVFVHGMLGNGRES